MNKSLASISVFVTYYYPMKVTRNTLYSLSGSFKHASNHIVVGQIYARPVNRRRASHIVFA